jgi:MazG family protein
MELLMQEFDRLIEIMQRVKTECPWDKQQTHESIRQFLLEETYEVIEAIDIQSDHSLLEELGDLQCQVIFHSLLAEERGAFTIKDVCTVIADKLVRRHPHVFGTVSVKNSDEVLKNWEHIKLSEGKKQSVLDGVPKDLPALTKAHRIQSKAGHVGFDWNTAEQVMDKINEELKEFQCSLVRNDKDAMEEELGDVLFSIVNIARKAEINPEDALRRTINKFIKRFHFIEEKLKLQGVEPKEATLEQMDALWNEAKKVNQKRQL